VPGKGVNELTGFYIPNSDFVVAGISRKGSSGGKPATIRIECEGMREIDHALTFRNKALLKPRAEVPDVKPSPVVEGYPATVGAECNGVTLALVRERLA
jgi:hypothetical protein